MTWPTTTSFDALFQAAAEQSSPGTGLDVAAFAALLKAHAAIESSLNPRAFRAEPGGRASRGLMQILDTTARSLGMTGSLGNDALKSGGLYDPRVAIPLAAELVAQNLRLTDGNLDAAIAAYNEGAGQANADAQDGAGWHTTDPRYVAKVRDAYTQYAADFQASSDEVSASDEGGMTITPAVLAGVAGLVLAFLVWWSRR